jgi:hypothetical protein
VLNRLELHLDQVEMTPNLANPTSPALPAPSVVTTKRAKLSRIPLPMLPVDPPELLEPSTSGMMASQLIMETSTVPMILEIELFLKVSDKAVLPSQS